MTMHTSIPVGLILDFDGTMIQEDVGNAICDQFAPPSWRDINDEYLRGELSIYEAQRRMWALVRASQSQIERFISSLARRDGLQRFMDRTAHSNIPLVIASGGFDWYIHRMLGPALTCVQRVYANQLVFQSDGSIRPSFPHLSTLGCHRCAVCKALVLQVVKQELGPEVQIIFVGDGASDECVATHADRVFTVRGSRFETFCAERGISHTPFDSFDEIAV